MEVIRNCRKELQFCSPGTDFTDRNRPHTTKELVANIASTRAELVSVLIHELVHTGGIGGQEASWTELLSFRATVNTHDLTFLGDKFKDILKHCTRERGSKLL